MLKPHDVWMTSKTIENCSFSLYLTQSVIFNHDILYILLGHSSLFDSFQSDVLVTWIHHNGFVHNSILSYVQRFALSNLFQWRGWLSPFAIYLQTSVVTRRRRSVRSHYRQRGESSPRHISSNQGLLSLLRDTEGIPQNWDNYSHQKISLSTMAFAEQGSKCRSRLDNY